MFAWSPASALASPANHASRISPEQRLGGAAQAEREHVGVVPAPGARGRGGVGAQRGAHAVDLVCGDRRAGARPAAHDRLLGAPVGDVAGGRLRRPCPVVALARSKRSVARSPRGPRRSSSGTRAPATPASSSAETAMRISCPPRPAPAPARPRPALGHQLQEQPVQTIVIAQLRVEGDREHRSPGARPPGGLRARRGPRPPAPCSAIHGRADEDPPDRRAVDATHVRRRPRSSAPGARKRCARRACPSAPRWSRSSMISPAHEPRIGRPRRGELAQRLGETLASIPSVIVVDSPPGTTSPSRPSRSAGTRTSRVLGAEPLEHPLVRVEAALQRQHADHRLAVPAPAAHQPRWARSCSSSSFELSRLTIARAESRARPGRRARGPASGSSPRRSRVRASADPRT